MEPNPEPQEEVKTVEGPSEIPEGHSVKYYEWTDDMTQKCQDVIDEDENYHPEAGKLKKHAGMNWHIFYSNNKTNFFKNRHYLIKEFTEMKEKCDDQEIVRLLDAGCGVGNALFPLCKDLPNLHVDAFDFALKAVNLVKEHEKFEEERMKVEQCDLVRDDIPFEAGTHDFAILIFVLSAIFPEHYKDVIQKVYDQLNQGGILYFRDYGKYDMAQMRFAKKKTSKVLDNFYVRGDKTLAYYFTIEEVDELMTSVGFKKLSLDYHYKEFENRKKGLKMHRVWIQAKYIKE
ncbi:unnamed protein product [Moneuplotes crassus]|uniref:tRNA N(3)-methylcytidine methyltransferase n=1 Tax=Euplotes crassus TaxID=5936 RepID=A0AAD1XN17_EUPCR|nr:unnamed protein product [Moneuplotes crassus]